ncbi:MAG: ring-cleaving dioxygenase [Bacteroidota bacterium]
MQQIIQHLHHVTATVSDAQEDLDFYVGILGLRLVKQTVNFDNRKVFHFYYGTEVGYPGTIMTTFPYKGQGVRDGVNGSGQVQRTSFSIPENSLSFWQERLQKAGVSFEEESRFGESVLKMLDPSGLSIELIESKDEREPWKTEEIPSTYAITGIHSVSLSIADIETTLSFLETYLGFQRGPKEGNRQRMMVGNGGSGYQIDILHQPELARGKNGLGTVHHVALAIQTEEEQKVLREKIVELGIKITEVLDRKYFRSIYFREPGGVLIEVATIPPGFTVDEENENLGLELKLPEWEEPLRAEIEAGLPNIKHLSTPFSYN